MIAGADNSVCVTDMNPHRHVLTEEHCDTMPANNNVCMSEQDCVCACVLVTGMFHMGG